MTDSGLDLVSGGPGEPPRRPGHRRAEKPKRKPWGRMFLVVVLLAALVGGGYWAYGKVSDFFAAPEDFVGEGTGEVVVEIPAGATGLDIANILFDAGVVASAEAFYELALVDPRGSTIEPGIYALRREMSAEWALTELVDRANRVEGRVVVPEGARVDQVVAAVVSNSEITEDELRAALADPASFGLPDTAEGDPEGYLFPATYTIQPGATAADVLTQMVTKNREVLESLDLASRAQSVGMSEREILTIASILEYEVRDSDLGMASRVIYNRLADGMLLQMDSTVHFASGRSGDIFTTPEERQLDSPYNTYRFEGLPPGPIGSPGEQAIEAALNPPEGTWRFFVADPETGETTFTDTFAEHQQACLAVGFAC